MTDKVLIARAEAQRVFSDLHACVGADAIEGRAILGAENMLRCALDAQAEPVAQEPVAWMVYTRDGKSAYVTDNPGDILPGQTALALYPHPMQGIVKGVTP